MVYDYLGFYENDNDKIIREKFFNENNYNFRFFESNEITRIAKNINPNANDKVKGWYFQVPCEKCGELFWARYIRPVLSHTNREHRDQKYCEKCSKRNKKRAAISTLNFIDINLVGSQCAICGKPYQQNTNEETFFHGHHIIEFSEEIINEEITNILRYYPMNLMLLCTDCHKKVHSVYKTITYEDSFIRNLYDLNKYMLLVNLYEDEKYSASLDGCRYLITNRINKLVKGE